MSPKHTTPPPPKPNPAQPVMPDPNTSAVRTGDVIHMRFDPPLTPNGGNLVIPPMAYTAVDGAPVVGCVVILLREIPKPTAEQIARAKLALPGRA